MYSSPDFTCPDCLYSPAAKRGILITAGEVILSHILKGLLHAEDARLALAHGVDGLIVSNHGGRQFDAAPSAISALPGVVAAVQGRMPVFMDSGIRRGSHIAKAIAIGATAVFVGRPVLFGLAARGAAGVDAVLKSFSDELIRTMILMGAPRLRDLQPSQPGRVEATQPNGVYLEYTNT